jgi:DNA polymerase III epsilon subunit-like protein
LNGIHKLMDEADAIVHYNGARFDVPTLNKEFLEQGMPPPSPAKPIDLLKTAKRRFRFPSNKLDFISTHLGLGSKTKHKGHQLWIDCLAGKEAAWRVMERYNKQDVRLLEKVYVRMLPWIPNHPNRGAYDGVAGCPHCGKNHIQRRGFAVTTSKRYPRFQCADCGTWFRGTTTSYTAIAA